VNTYLLIATFINFATGLVLAFAVALRGRSNRINRRLAGFALSISIWAAAAFLMQISESAGRALLFARLQTAVAAFIAVAFLHFVVQLCGGRRRWWFWFGYSAAIGLAGASFAGYVVTAVQPGAGVRFWPQAGPGVAVLLAVLAVYLRESLRLLRRQERAATGARADQLRQIRLATLIGLVGAALNVPSWYGLPVPPLGDLFVFVSLAMIGHAVSRYQLPLAIYDFVHAAVYMGMSVVISVGFMLAYAGLSAWQGAHPDLARLVNVFLLGMMVSLFFFWVVPRLKDGADQILLRTYLRKRGSQHNRLKNLAEQISTLDSEQEILDTTAREIAEAVGFSHLGIFIRGEFGDAYALRAQTRWGRDGYTQTALPAHSRLVRVLAQRQAPVIFDGSESELFPEFREDIEEMRRTMPFEAAFPILTEGFLLGVLVLSPRERRERYTEIDLSLLEAVCRQLGVTLRVRQLERRASQTEKLISLGTLAAGLAHELRNPLVSIQTFSALLKEHGHEPEFQQEFGAIIQRDVGRIASIVENIAAFAENSTVPFAAVKIGEVIAGVAEIVRPELLRTGVLFQIAELRSLPPVYGNYSQLLQVFLNLVQNALHALEGQPDGRIAIAVELRAGNVPKPMLHITVADNGPGIDPALLPRVFEPFVTTKSTGDRRGQRGMGLGLAIVRRIVQYHEGAIEVTSEIGKGTTFHLHLPIPDQRY